MKEPIKKLNALAGTFYFSKKAGSFSGAAQRTIQTWTEKGLISDPGTTGTGIRRKYTALNCIEMAIIKALADMRIGLPIIKEVMEVLRRNNNLLGFLKLDYAFLFVNFKDDGTIDHYGFGFDKEDIEARRKIISGAWMHETFRPDCVTSITINLTKIAEQVLSKM